MNTEIAHNFLTTLTEQTLGRNIEWYWDSSVYEDDPKKFVGNHEGVEFVLLATTPKIELVVTFPQKSAFTMSSLHDDKIDSAVVRLFNAVHSVVPNMEDEMKNFIETFQ